ncbi:hypothetical protein CYMTET_39773, partial [Cymbomonas tetramitiformis]
MKVGKVYEVNTLHVLGEQNAGLAPAKVEKLLTSLGIEYALHRTNHGSMQKHVGAMVETMAKVSCERAFEDEVGATLERGGNTDTEIVNGTTYVNLGATGDCAWPTRGSGHSYASFCGGFILMGAINKKVMSASIFSKMCSTCEAAEKTAEKEKKAPVYPTHDCFRGCRGIMADSDSSWRGSSKAMEPKGALSTALGLGKHCLKRDILKSIIARKIQYKLLEALRVAEKWKGGILSKAVIDYLNRLYRYVIKSVAAKDDLEWAIPEDEKIEWLQGAVVNVVDHAFGKHENCGKYRIPLGDGTWHSWCGVDANEPDYKPHLPHGKFLAPDDPPGYYEKVKAVFVGRLADKKVLQKQLHDTDTNSNESYNSMVVRGTLPGGKAQQNGQSGVFFWAHCHAIMMKNEGTGYRRELCARVGIDPPESMYALDERVQRRKEKAAALRVSHEGARKR